MAHWHCRCTGGAWNSRSSWVIRRGKEVLWDIRTSCDIQSSVWWRWSWNEASYAYVGELLSVAIYLVFLLFSSELW